MSTTILAILLYLQLLISPGTYTQDYIDQLVQDNQAQIDAVQNDPAQMEIVNAQYLPLVDQIVIDPGVVK